MLKIWSAAWLLIPLLLPFGDIVFPLAADTSALIVSDVAHPGILDGLVDWFQANPLIVILIGILIAVVITFLAFWALAFIQSLALLALGLDRLLGRLQPRSGSDVTKQPDQAGEVGLTRRWLRSIWKQSGD